MAVHVPLENAVVPGWPDDNPGRIRASINLAEALGAEVVIHHLPTRFRLRWINVGGGRLPLPLAGQDSYRRWLLTGYPALREETGITLCIENLPAMRCLGRRFNPGHWNNAAEIVRFPALTLDTTHLGTWGLDPTEVYGQLGGRVRHVHLSNFNGREHRRLEDGHLRLDRLLARLAADGYTGAVSIELSPDALNAGAPDDEVAGLMAASLAYCRKAVGTP